MATNGRKILFLAGTPFYFTIYLHEVSQPEEGNPACGAEQGLTLQSVGAEMRHLAAESSL